MLRMRKPNKAKRPNMDGINLLVSILVCYPEISMVSYDPEREALDFSFALSGIPGLEAYGTIKDFIGESILTYHDLEGFSQADIEIALEIQGPMSFLHIIRDVYTLSRGEISLVVTLMRERFEETLIRESDRDVDEGADVAQEEAIDHMIGSLKINHMSDRMVGIREEGRVMVYNK